MLPSAVADLGRSGLSAADAEAAGIYSVTDAREVHPKFEPYPALVLPYYLPDGSDLKEWRPGAPFVRVRMLDVPQGFLKKQRYTQPPGSGIHVYWPQGTPVNWAATLQDSRVPILITEGEKKALVACLHGAACLGLGGVFNFAMPGEGLLPELEAVNWRERDVYIVFDSDASTNSNVMLAESRLATELSLKRRANVHVVRLPQLDGKKCGLDDYILARGWDGFLDVLEDSPQVRKADAEIFRLNQEAAWIETDGMVYDIRDRGWIRKTDFTNGSRFSTIKLEAPGAKGKAPKQISVAAEWLQHPHARRYKAVTFNPTTDAKEVPLEDGGMGYNLWEGLDTTPGDVRPWLELSAHLFRHLPEDVRDLPIRLLAYKVQNLAGKVPLALVFIGKQGCGKSFWCKIVRSAFGAHGVAVPENALKAAFNGWMERALFAVFDEAKAKHLQDVIPALYSIVSEDRVLLNEKYRAARQVDVHTLIALTSNDPRVGAFSADDRRMIVINTGDKGPDSLYERVDDWYKAGGARHVIHWLQNLDLKGWKPPKKAPMTAEKYMAYRESLSPAQRLAEEMRTADANVVTLWIDSALTWAQQASMSGQGQEQQLAREIQASMHHIQIRDWYTAEELALMFPAIVGQLHSLRSVRATPAGEISAQLREAGIGYLTCADRPEGFMWRGRLCQFLVVANPEQWTRPVTQAHFDHIMRQWPTFGTVRGLQQAPQRIVPVS